MNFLRKVTPALLFGFIITGCQWQDSPESTGNQIDKPPVFRVIGTEPFWGLDINDQGLRFTTPENMEGLVFPPFDPAVDGDSLRWSGETERRSIDVHIQPGECSDMMSDKLWTHTAVVQIDGTSYRGCAEIPVEASAAHDPIGDWIVVHHRLPGVSAMDYDEAVGWHGRIIHLGAGEARSAEDSCDSPDYRYRKVSADDYLRDGFRITSDALGLEEAERLGVTEVFCGGDHWTAPGGLLIWADDRPPFTVWDGVFFELRRIP